MCFPHYSYLPPTHHFLTILQPVRVQIRGRVPRASSVATPMISYHIVYGFDDEKIPVAITFAVYFSNPVTVFNQEQIQSWPKCF